MRLSDSFACTSKLFSANPPPFTYNRPLTEYISEGTDVLEGIDFVTCSAVADRIQIDVRMRGCY